MTELLKNAKYIKTMETLLVLAEGGVNLLGTIALHRSTQYRIVLYTRSSPTMCMNFRWGKPYVVDVN